MSRRPCLTCGEVSEGSRCPDHTRERHRDRTSARSRGYDGRHDRLSKRARKLQPFCLDCLTTENLTLHHTEEAWRRHEARKPPRLSDYVVLCGPCNNRRGSSRTATGLDKPRGRVPPETDKGPFGQAESRLHTGMP